MEKDGEKGWETKENSGHSGDIYSDIYNRRDPIRTEPAGTDSVKADPERTDTQAVKAACVRMIARGSAEYPAKLENIPSPPKMLYVLGGLPDPALKSVAVIGARVCSEYGRAMAGYFCRELAAQGVQIISGMARGVDGIGQWAALEAGGRSFGVLGSGVDVCYPRENRFLYERLKAEGGVLSEQPLGTQPVARYFPARNRIISGLSDLILVIEARQKSGTQITVDMALEQGRDIAVVPGRIGDALSEGCNQMIRQGAALVLKPGDVLQMLGLSAFSGEPAGEKAGKEKKKALEKKENMVYSCLDLFPVTLDEIVNKVPLSVPEVLHILLQLKVRGYVREIGKNCYVRGG